MKLCFVVVLAGFLCGCSTAIGKDTQFSLKGPKAEVKRVF